MPDTAAKTTENKQTVSPRSAQMVFPPPQFAARYLLPRYWGVWLGIMLLLPLAFLPWCLQLLLGNALGYLIWTLGKRRRHDTLINLRLCFPDKSPAEHQRMGLEVFQNAGVGIFESLGAWFFASRYRRHISIDGLEHINNAQQAERGVLVLGAHYTLLDLGGLLCSRFFKASIIYRPQNNLLLEWLIYRARQNIFGKQLDHKDMRGLMRSLKNNEVIWYTPDQDFGEGSGVMARFFDVPAMTITAQRRLAKINHAVVLAIHFYRVPPITVWQKIGFHQPAYQIKITSPLDHYPSDNEVADANRINQLLESLINIAPTQYMWFHRRFKTQPQGSESFY